MSFAVERMLLTVWAPAQGLSDIYGDPARGFAGGYLATIREKQPQ